MPYILTDFETAVASRIQDAAQKLQLGDIDDAISQAVRGRYSHNRPRELASDVTGVNPPASLIALPEGPSDPAEPWEDGFSVIRSIEFPVGDIPPTYLLEDQWLVYRTPTGLKLMVMGFIPQASDTMRVIWTVRHSPGTAGQTPTPTTIPDSDFEAVCDLASAMCCEKLAAIYAQTRDPSIQADAVNYRTKSQEYLTLAKALRQRYFDHIGIEEDGTGKGAGPAGPAIAIGDQELRQGSGVDRLTHRRPR